MFIKSYLVSSLGVASSVHCLGIPSLESRIAAPELEGKRSVEVRDGVEHTLFEHEVTGGTIDFVTNSGICETTPGVNQYSGYLSVGSMLNEPPLHVIRGYLT